MNDQISRVYNVYAPYLKNSQGLPTKQIKYDKLKNVDKYYDYNIYRSKKEMLHLKNNIVVPNRKLSPIGNKQMMKI